MGRQSNVVIFTAVLSLSGALAGSIHAQPPGNGGRHHASPVFRNSMRERFNALTPEDRVLFRRNAERWMQMGPQERELMRQREIARRTRMQQEADAAMREAGLRLDQQRRELFEQRYLQERRKIERDLIQEIERKRQTELPALNDRLRKEFQENSSAAGAGTAKPTGSSTPKH